MRLSQALLDILRSEGVDRIFGNPGTTELPLMDELSGVADLEYVLGAHEGPVVAMADGYARALGRPAFVNLHVAAGTANGMIGLHNARRSQTPLVVTAGQQDRRHLDQGPMLGGDLVGMAAPVCKAALEVHHAPDLPQMLRRAFLTARTPPSGPVFVSIPMDVLLDDLRGPLPARSALHLCEAAGGVAEAAAELAAAEAPALLAGDAIGREGAVQETVALAEAVGATVYLHPMYDAVNFPATHPLCAGALPPDNEEIHAALSRHDVVLIAGGHAFAPHYYTRRDAIPEGVRLLQLDSDPAAVGRNYPVAVGMAGGMRATLAALAGRLAGRVPGAGARLAEAPEREDARLEREREALSRYDRRPTDPEAAAHALARALPPGAVLIEEAITVGPRLRDFVAPDRPGSFHHTVGGGLGWGIGAGIGVKFARPDDPVVAVVGDGCAMFGLQGLWTAARYQVPVVFAVLNNGEYRVLKQGLDGVDGRGAEEGRYPAMDLAPPAIDWVGLARSLGVRGRRVEAAADVADAMRDAVRSGEPTLLDIPIAPKPKTTRTREGEGPMTQEVQDEQATELLGHELWNGKLFAGTWTSMNGKVQPVTEPATGESLGEVAVARPEDIARAAGAAAEAQPAWSKVGFEERAEVLRRAAAVLDRHHEELATWIVRETGGVRPKAEHELQGTREELLQAAAMPSQPYGQLLPTTIEGRTSMARRIPVGVVGVIAPWNFPLLLAMRSVAPALAVGNAVVLKPDLNTPVVGGVAIARMFQEAGLPENVLQVLPGGPEAGEALVEDRSVGMISFTGSSAVGRRVGELASKNLKKVVLELGGNNVLIVLDDADVEVASSAGAWGSFLHQGQICMTTGRHLVHDSLADRYLEALVTRAERLKVGDPNTVADAALGPLINDKQLERVSTIVEETVSAGANLRSGGTHEGRLYRPTVLDNVTPSMRAFSDEVFGPVAPVTAFGGVDEALDLAHMSDYGLSAAIHTRSPSRALQLAGRLRAGMVHINDGTVNDEPQIPFGGVGASGNGSRFGGEANWEAFTQWQWVTLRDEAQQFPF